MSTIDLIVLGILVQGARNAYELVRFIRERELGRVLKISEPAVFKSCRRLAEGGYIDGETVRESGVPDKVVYSVNDKGMARFHELLAHFSQGFKPYHLEINTVIWNLDQLERDEGRKLLLELQQQIHLARDMVTQHEAEIQDGMPFGPRQIVKQYRMTFTTLAEWIDEVLAEYA